MPMTKTEREELRRLVRQRFKVLRKEVDQRGAELTADLEQALVARFHDRDGRRVQAEGEVAAIVEEANRKVLEVLRQTDFDLTGVGRSAIPTPRVMWDQTDRQILRIAALADVEAKKSAAKLTLERQEVDVLQRLAMGALESEEARDFLGSIPSVGELVPAARLDELEAALEAPEDPRKDWRGKDTIL